MSCSLCSALRISFGIVLVLLGCRGWTCLVEEMGPFPGFELLNAVPPICLGQQSLAGLPLEQHSRQQEEEFPCPYGFVFGGGIKNCRTRSGQSLADTAAEELRGLLEEECFGD